MNGPRFSTTNSATVTILNEDCGGSNFRKKPFGQAKKQTERKPLPKGRGRSSQPKAR